MNPRLATRIERAGVGGASLRLSREGVAMAFGEVPANGAMCVEGARRVWVDDRRTTMAEADGATGVESARWAGVEDEAGRGRATLAEALRAACLRVPAGRVALALSGGVDSAVLAALLRDRVTLYTLETGMRGYCEAEEAQAVADLLKMPLCRVRVGEGEFLEGLPGAIAGGESPLYNLHPVSRHLLARAVRRDGFDVLVTGDGADEVFRGTEGWDHLPIVGGLMRAAGVVGWAPFLDVGGVERDPDKRALRVFAEELGVPGAMRPKLPRFAPAMDVLRYWDEAKIFKIGRMLGREPSRATDRERVGWTTLRMFVDSFPGLRACAG